MGCSKPLAASACAGGAERRLAVRRGSTHTRTTRQDIWPHSITIEFQVPPRAVRQRAFETPPPSMPSAPLRSAPCMTSEQTKQSARPSWPLSLTLLASCNRAYRRMLGCGCGHYGTAQQLAPPPQKHLLASLALDTCGGAEAHQQEPTGCLQAAQERLTAHGGAAGAEQQRISAGAYVGASVHGHEDADELARVVPWVPRPVLLHAA